MQGLTSAVVTEDAIREPLQLLELSEHEVTTSLYAHHSISAISQLGACTLADTTALPAVTARRLEDFFC
jgi:hypothetical protein